MSKLAPAPTGGGEQRRAVVPPVLDYRVRLAFDFAPQQLHRSGRIGRRDIGIEKSHVSLGIGPAKTTAAPIDSPHLSREQF